MLLTKKIRFSFLFLTKVVRRRYLTLLISLCFGIGCFYLYPKIVKFLPVGVKSQKVGMVGRFTVNDLPDEILLNISFGLTKVAPNGEPAANLAQSWEATEEGKTYIFSLRESELYWHDNSPFSPKDINYNFKDVSFSQEGNRITFKLKEPFSPFPIITAKPLFKKGLTGLGDYQVKNIIKRGKIITKISLKPFGKNVKNNKVYRFYNNEEALKTAFNLGEINEISSLFDAVGIEPGRSVTIKESIDKNSYVAIFFNTNHPALSEKIFRQALAYATPRDFRGLRALGPLSPNSWAYNPDVKPYNFDLAHAKELLPKPSKIKISTLPRYENIAEKVKKSWKQLGIDSEVVINAFVPDDFDVLIAARSIPRDPDQYYFWHSTQKGNLTGLKSPKIDKLLEDGRRVNDKEERKGIYFDFQRFLTEECPAVFLFYPVTYQVTRN